MNQNLPSLMGGRAALIAAVVTGLALGGCDANHQDLQSWMDSTRQSTPTEAATIAEPKTFEAYRYRTSGVTDPFSLARLKGGEVTTLPGTLARAGSGLQPNLKRAREPLEAFPLESLSMVGNLKQGAAQVALLRADTMLYQVKVGNHVGQNFGQITRITDSGVAIREMVQDAAGDWVQRETELRLQETSK
jgi:type IV pilus assembly protein PilP